MRDSEGTVVSRLTHCEARGAVFQGPCNELSLLMKHSPGARKSANLELAAGFKALASRTTTSDAVFFDRRA